MARESSMRYRCIKTMFLDKYDEDGFLMEGKYMTIPEGSIWERQETERIYNIVGDKDCLHLERIWKSKKAKSVQWIEVTKERLAEYFEQIEQKGE